MLDILKALAHGVGDMTYGDPDDADAVKAADVVRWAAAEIARLREERRWVPVGERLPTEQGEDVLTAIQFDDGSHDINLSWWNGECWIFYGAHVPGGPVTHWQPLPPGPVVEG
jgi:hypothetical protein